jgi:hypothetical protein
MMISAVVFTALRGLVADRVYPATFIQPDGSLPSWPAIRYATVDAVADVTICGNDLGETDDEHVQIDIAAKSFGAMIALRDQVYAALQNVEPPATRERSQWTVDTRTKTYRAIIEYTFHPSSQ